MRFDGEALKRWTDFEATKELNKFVMMRTGDYY